MLCLTQKDLICSREFLQDTVTIRECYGCYGRADHLCEQKNLGVSRFRKGGMR